MYICMVMETCVAVQADMNVNLTEAVNAFYATSMQ